MNRVSGRTLIHTIECGNEAHKEKDAVAALPLARLRRLRLLRYRITKVLANSEGPKGEIGGITLSAVACDAARSATTSASSASFEI